MEAQKYIPALKYDWLTKVYDPVLQLTMPERKFKEALISYMSIQPGERVLDFGCGSLTLSIMAAQRQPQAEFYGVDIDAKILSIAGKKLASDNLPIQIQQYDGVKLPYPDGYFNHVMSSLVFHHLTQRQKYAALDEILRVLRPTGKLSIADFGKPANIFQRIGFYAVQFLDGFETTSDSVTNILPNALSFSGYSKIEEKASFNTMVGTVRLIQGTKKSVIL
jgi:ubiquinone/menaquinone biosynthesis C-methylase UbiE